MMLWRDGQVGVYKDFEHRAGVAFGGIDDTLPNGVPAASTEHRPCAVKDRVARIRDPVRVHR